MWCRNSRGRLTITASTASSRRVLLLSFNNFVIFCRREFVFEGFDGFVVGFVEEVFASVLFVTNFSPSSSLRLP